MKQERLTLEVIANQYEILIDRETRLIAVKRGESIGPFFSNWHDCVDWLQDTDCGAIALDGYDIEPHSGLYAALIECHFHSVLGKPLLNKQRLKGYFRMLASLGDLQGVAVILKVKTQEAWLFMRRKVKWIKLRLKLKRFIRSILGAQL